MLRVAVHKDINDTKPDEYDVTYVSWISDSTYGPPAIVAPAKGKETTDARARAGDTVLYLNTKFVPMVEIERIS